MADNQELVFDFKAGRGENGFSATLDIVPAGMKTEPTVASTVASAPVAKANITSTPEARKEPEAKAEKAETKNVSKPSFSNAKKADPETENQKEADTGSSLDDRGNTMTGGSDETAAETKAEAPAPRGIFSKANAS